jgi:hypothetical protein
MKPTILVISAGFYSFVENDINILKHKFEVITYIVKPEKGVKAIRNYLKLAFFLSRNIRKIKFYFVWFADYHSFMAAVFAFLFKKRLFIVIGGYDAANLKELGYGVHTNWFRSFLVKLSCLQATKIFPVSVITQKLLFDNIHLDLSYKSKIIYNLVNTNFFSYNKSVAKENTVICVSNASNLKTMQVKGIDFFAEVARNTPEFKFILVGISGVVQKNLSEKNIKNLAIFPFLDKQHLVQLLQISKVICQFSLYESFGVALAEGMLMGCVPITIQNLGAAEVVDENFGIILENQDLALASNAVREAILKAETLRLGNIDRIKQHFSLELRKSRLLEELT